MLVRIDTPYADTTAGDLSFALCTAAGACLPPQPALHVLAIPAAGLELRLLGASHQVALAGRCVETVACLPGRSPSLPSAVARDGYRFSAEIRRVTPAGMSDAVRELREQLDGDPYALVGLFPGGPEAITALRAEILPRAVRWHTWHAYPQSGELVLTRTEVDR